MDGFDETENTIYGILSENGFRPAIALMFYSFIVIAIHIIKPVERLHMGVADLGAELIFGFPDHERTFRAFPGLSPPSTRHSRHIQPLSCMVYLPLSMLSPALA